MIGGMNILVSEHATEKFRIFPDRKRTKRGNRRFRAKWGSDIRRRPCAYKTPFGLVVHPTLYAALRAQFIGGDNG